MERLIFHVDVNSAYLSWEAARRVQEGLPDLRLIPSAIGGDKDKRTGIILAKSIPAKKFGVTTGEPVSMALRKCPGLEIAKPDFELYIRNSRAFMEVCRSYAPAVEQYSIDECFLDMSGTGYIYPDPIATAHEIKNKIRDELGFTVNVGIGSNKLLAKMASDFEKPDKVHTLFKDEIEEKMWTLSVGDLFLVGKSSAEKLNSKGVKTIGDLACADLEYIQAAVGEKFGYQIWNYANGKDSSPVVTEREDPKGYSISTTLEDNVESRESARQIIRMLCDSVSRRMRRDGARAYCVAVTIRDTEFKNRSHQRSLKTSTDISSQIFEICAELFDELWDGKTPLRLLGVALTDIDRVGTEQTSLFDDGSRERARNLDKAMDLIKSKYGHSTIQRASEIKSGLDVGKKFKAQDKIK